MGIPSRPAWLRWGFMNPDQAETPAYTLEKVKPGLACLVAEIASGSADPDLGFSAMADLSADWDVSGVNKGDPGWIRLIRLLGSSLGLGRWLRRRPDDASVCFDTTEPWSKAQIQADIFNRINVDNIDSIAELRWAYRRHLMRIAARDLMAPQPESELEMISRQLSDLADAVIEAGLSITKGLVPDYGLIRFAVIGFGKTGARESNYLSDVDVMYLAEPGSRDGEQLCSPDQAIRIGTQVATTLTRVCSSHTGAGTIWELDATLRPEGATGPLVRSLTGMKNYYQTWASNWEFQALLKARAMAGDLELGNEFIDAVSPLVWTAAERDDFVAQAQAMRARVIAMIPPAQSTQDIKLASGGLRDTEFAVQILQLVHGRVDQRVREAATLPALAKLINYGYVGRADGAELDRAYRFQRLLEHRLQLYYLRRTHLMPTSEPELRRLARFVGMKDASQVLAAWRSSAVTVHRLHQRIYYSPVLEAVARIPTEAIRMSEEAAIIRLKALGYADPMAALHHIEALTQGLTRQAEILGHLLPALLGWIATGVNPDAGLLAFRGLADGLGSTPFFLRALRDEGQIAQDLARVLSTSRYAAAILQRSPASAEIIFSPPGQTTFKQRLSEEFRGVLTRYGSDARIGEVIRATRRRELLRIAMADILGQADVITVGQQLSELNDVTVATGLEAARHLVDDPPTLAVIALGRWGGQEMAYSSDADLMVILQDSDDPHKLRQAAWIIQTMKQLLKTSGIDPDLKIDLGLRPEGKDGPLVRTLSSTCSYYTKWSAIWEAQALLRARHGAGDEQLSQQFLATIESVRYPQGGITTAQTTEIRQLKARMETERIGRGINPKDHLKLGPGSLSDVEWTVQYLQLQHAWQVPGLRTTNTLDALDAAIQAGLIEMSDAISLKDAFLLASRIRNGGTLLRNKPCDVLSANSTDLSQIGQILGYAKTQGSQLHDDWLRLARRARTVADKVLYEGMAT